MRRMVAAGLAGMLLCGLPAAGSEHVVPPARIGERLMEASRTRAADLEQVDAVLSQPEVARVAASVGLDVDALRGVATQLDGAELHDLGLRAQALRTDPVAGSPIVPGVPRWVVVASVLVVLAALAGVVWAIAAIAG